jgi:hypothetical protein
LIVLFVFIVPEGYVTYLFLGSETLTLHLCVISVGRRQRKTGETLKPLACVSKLYLYFQFILHQATHYALLLIDIGSYFFFPRSMQGVVDVLWIPNFTCPYFMACIILDCLYFIIQYLLEKTTGVRGGNMGLWDDNNNLLQYHASAIYIPR